jgi:hypothetical protein
VIQIYDEDIKKRGRLDIEREREGTVLRIKSCKGFLIELLVCAAINFPILNPLFLSLFLPAAALYRRRRFFFALFFKAYLQESREEWQQQGTGDNPCRPLDNVAEYSSLPLKLIHLMADSNDKTYFRFSGFSFSQIFYLSILMY